MPLVEMHQLSYYLYESIVLLKSYAMEYFGWETPFGEFFINNSQKANFSFLTCMAYFLSGSCIV
jgi:hypothetical protein